MRRSSKSPFPLQDGGPLKDKPTVYCDTVYTKLEMGSVARQQKRAESVILVAHEHPDFPPPP